MSRAATIPEGVSVEVWVARVAFKYEITAVGGSERQARQLLAAAAVRYFAAAGETLRSDWQEWYDVDVQRLEVGKAYFDGGKAGEARTTGPIRKRERV